MRLLWLLLGTALVLPGCDFTREGYLPPAVHISGVILQDFPLTRDGNPWDPDGAADVAVEIQNIGGTAFARSAVVPNVASLPENGLTLDLDLDVRGERTFYLVVLDDDGPTSEIIAVSEPFSYADLEAAAADTMSIQDDRGRLRALLRLTP